VDCVADVYVPNRQFLGSKETHEADWMMMGAWADGREVSQRGDRTDSTGFHGFWEEFGSYPV
jgi:hypothetical protein